MPGPAIEFDTVNYEALWNAAAAAGAAGITIPFADRASMLKCQSSMYQLRTRRGNQAQRDYAKAVAAGEDNPELLPPLETGWEGLTIVRLKNAENTLWIGRQTLAGLGILSVMEGKPT